MEEYVVINKKHIGVLINELLLMPMRNVEGVVNFLRNSLESVAISQEQYNKLKETLEKIDE